jgi:hypothetical protein
MKTQSNNRMKQTGAGLPSAPAAYPERWASYREGGEGMKQAFGSITVALVGSVVMGLTCAGPATAEEDVRAALEARNRKLEEAVSRGDVAAMAALYTADGQLLPAQSDFVTGTKAIGQFWQAVFDAGIKAASLTTVEVSAHGDTADEVGR